MSWRDMGLRFLPHGGRRPILVGLAAGLVFGAYMAIADALLFQSVIPPSQQAMISSLPALRRIFFFTPLAVVDEVVYRLVLMSAVVWLLTLIVGKPRSWCYWAAILASALVFYPAGHWGYLATLDPGPLTWAREIGLHGAAGVLWGYLYWRHGLVTSVVGHVSAHLSLQPLLSLFFN